MPDDLLDLRLRTAKALKWVVENDILRGESRHMLLRRNGEGRTLWIQPDGTVKETRATLPDYPADLGACVEVFAAIEARLWEWELSCSIGVNGEKRYYMGIEKAERGENSVLVYPVSEAEADSRPAAICEAFCEAVEAKEG